jgi:type IV pilus assembly protein PilM
VPQRLFLSGGASIMPYTAQFFAEKLSVPVEYFNPFRNVQIDPAVNLEELARVAHSLGEVVGLGLRNLANCPVEMNLMPDSTLRWRAFNEKKPYFMATIFLLALVAGAIGFLFQKLATAKEKEHDDLEPQVAVIQDKGAKMKQAYDRLQHTQDEANQICNWMEGRYYWGDILTELRSSLIRSEDAVRKKYAAQKPGMEAGIWIEQMTPAAVAPAASADNGAAQPPPGQANSITLVCRAVDLTQMDPAADNTEIVYAVERELKACPMFDPKLVQSSAQISQMDSNGTFTFNITLVPQNPLKL